MVFKNQTARTLYIFAWIVEIIAVVIGLAISLLIGFDAWGKVVADKEVSTSDYINVFIAAMPFFLVAVVEITKIPVAGAAYLAKGRGWKWLFGFTLLFLAGITFETAFNGFERTVANIQYLIEEKMNTLQSIEKKIAGLEDDRAVLSELTRDKIEATYNSRRAIITKTRDENLDNIEGQRDKLNNTPQVESIKFELEQLKERRETLIKERNETEKQARNNFNSDIEEKRNQKNEEKKRIREEIADTNTRIREVNQQINKTGPFAIRKRGELKRELSDLKIFLAKKEEDLVKIGDVNSLQLSGYISSSIEEKNKSINDLDDKIDAKNRELSKVIASKKRTDQQERLDSDMARINEDFNVQQDKNKRDREKSLAELREKEERITIINNEIEQTKANEREVRNEINSEARDTQIYRLTRYWTGEKAAADLSPDQVAITAFIWFGSLAMVIALTGILLALGAYVLEFGVDRARDNSPSPWRKAGNSLRRGIVFARRVPRREKTVTKFVPKEVIVKELVHVPVLVGGEHRVTVETAREKSGQTEKAKIGDQFPTASPDNGNNSDEREK